MNYAHIFQALYLEPLCLEISAFHALHQVVWPRLSGQALDQDLTALFAAVAQPHQIGPRRVNVIAQRADEKGKGTGQYFGTLAGRKDVAILPVSGMISRNASFIQSCLGNFVSPDAISFALAQAVADPDISKIVLDMDTPGGRTTAMPELAAQIRAATALKTVYSFTDSLNASAGQWLSSQVTESYVTPSSTSGSIGTIIAYMDESSRLAKKGVKMEVFQAGTHKSMGHPGTSLSDQDKAYIQGRVDKINGQFTTAVKTARPQVSEESLRDAKVYDGEEAVAHGLADGLVSSWAEFTSLL